VSIMQIGMDRLLAGQRLLAAGFTTQCSLTGCAAAS